MDSIDKSPSTTVRRHRKISAKSRGKPAAAPRQGVLESLATLSPEVRSAVPLVAGSTAAPGSTLAQWVSTRAMSLGKADALLGGEDQAPPAPERVSAMALLSYSTRREKWLMLGGLISAGVAGLAMPVWLLLLAKSLETFNNLGKLINSVGGDAAVEILKDQLYQLCWSFAVVGFVSLLSGSVYVSIWTYTGERQSLRIREKFVHSAFRQDAKWFDARGDPQELPTLATNALERINDAIGRTLADAFANLLSAVCCLAVAIGLNAPLALIMLCMLPVIAICVALVSCYMRKRSGQALEIFASAGAFATEVISGSKTIASLSAERWSANKYEGMAREAQKHSIWSGYLSKLTSGIMGVLFYITYTIAFLFGTEQVANTLEVEESKPLNPFYCMINYCGISGSEVMVCIYGVILCAQFFSLMSPAIQAVNLGRIAAADIFGAINHTPDIDSSSDEDGAKIENYQGGFELNRVAFAYPSRPDDLIFRDLSLAIGPGQAVALVGPSGSGKSTISKLLLRLYDPLAGNLLVDGIPLKEVNLKWWRSQIGYVPQEPHLFIGSIRYNIACGKAGGTATDEEVITAAKAACAHEFIESLPDGYDTFYSGASIQMSGGQIQRIAIARALIRNCSILLLDEATSALDSESERVVQDALSSIRKTRKLTTVTVAHRLSTIVASDQIAVIAEGSIQELGTHRELLEEDGIYATLCESQGIGADAADAISSVPQSQAEPSSIVQPSKEGTVINPTGDPDDPERGIPVTKEGDADDSEEDEEGQEEELASMSRLWLYNKAEWGYLVLGTVGALVVGVLPPAEGILYAQLTANFFTMESAPMREQNTMLSLCFLALAAASLLGNMAMGCGFSVAGFRLTRRLRVLCFEKIMRQSIAWFDYSENSTGELTERLEADAEAVNKVTGWNLGQQIQVFSSLACGIVISLSFSWQIGLIAIGCVPLIMGAAFVQAKCTRRRVVKHDGVSSATILERGLDNIALIQAYDLSEKVSDQYSASLAPVAKDKVRQGVISGAVFGFSQFAIFCTFAVLFYAGIQLMIKGQVSFTAFFTALLAIMFAAFGVGSVNADFNSKYKGLTAAQRIFNLIDAPLDNDDPLSTAGTKPESLTGNITFKGISFSYPTRPDHLIYYSSHGRDGFSLSIPSKESMAFVGRSGCGKSTALQLLLKFYEVNSGCVALDDADIRDLNTKWLRDNIGYVGQMPVLFAGSVRMNILLGKPDATEDEIVQAAKAANAYEFISRLSEGFETDIGAGGSLLSGGQKQRLAIARAIISDPAILVLDEATSALDNESERIVQQTLDDMQAKKPRTTLVVAHRLTTIRNCDKIAVLDRGGIKELGSHSELLKEKGLYNDLWMKQGAKED